MRAPACVRSRTRRAYPVADCRPRHVRRAAKPAPSDRLGPTPFGEGASSSRPRRAAVPDGAPAPVNDIGVYTVLLYPTLLDDAAAAGASGRVSAAAAFLDMSGCQGRGGPPWAPAVGRLVRRPARRRYLSPNGIFPSSRSRSPAARLRLPSSTLNPSQYRARLLIRQRSS